MKSISDSVNKVSQALFEDVEKAQSVQDIERVKTEYLGRQGILTGLMGQLKDLPPDEKRRLGPELNRLKERAYQALEHKRKIFEEKELKQALERSATFDVTAYQRRPRGSLHPYTHLIERIETIFVSMGFSIAEGPEVETPFYNFEALNIPSDHPARELHDTFWLTLPGHLMRTHTSSVQVHSMQQTKPPLALCCPGRAYRHEATDATHDFVFTQLEALMVDKHLSVANLIGTVKIFLQTLFERPALDIRVRPSYFPFVEPGIEIDISCSFCTQGCTICKKRRWIELGGAGMVHPHVLSACGIDPEQWSGFAWGMGIERIAMLMYGISDVRLFKSERIEFLKQFE